MFGNARCAEPITNARACFESVCKRMMPRDTCHRNRCHANTYQANEYRASAMHTKPQACDMVCFSIPCEHNIHYLHHMPCSRNPESPSPASANCQRGEICMVQSCTQCAKRRLPALAEICGLLDTSMLRMDLLCTRALVTACTPLDQVS